MAVLGLVMLREGLEAALIIGIILAYLAKTGNRVKFGVVGMGIGLAVLMSVIVGTGIFVTAGEITGRAKQLLVGTAMISAAGALTYTIFPMRNTSTTTPTHLQP